MNWESPVGQANHKDCKDGQMCSQSLSCHLLSCPGHLKRFTVGEIPRVIWAKAIFTPDEISSVAHKVYEPQVVNLHLALQTFEIKKWHEAPMMRIEIMFGVFKKGSQKELR